MNPCTICGKLMRPKRTKRDTAPGTVAYGARGRCAACVQRASRLVERRTKRVASVAPKSVGYVYSAPEDCAKVARMVTARFPGDRDMLLMLGLPA